MAVNDFNEIPEDFSFFLDVEDSTPAAKPDALKSEDQDDVPEVASVGTPVEEPEDAPVDDTAPTEDSNENNPPAPEGKPQKNDEVRYEFWQSEATKYKQELEKLNPYVDIAKFLKENPNALDAVNNVLSQDIKPKAQERPDVTNTIPEPKKPEPPQRPEGYNRSDLLDPDSATSKYEDARAQYQIDMINYYEQKENFKETQRARAFQEEQNRLAETQRKAEFDRQLLANGLKPEEIERFYNVMNDPRSVDPKNVISYFRVLEGASTQSNNRQNEFERQQKRASVPPPAGSGGGGEAPKTLSEEEMFNSALLFAGNKTRS